MSFNVSGQVIITALPPISTVGMSIDDVQDLMDKTRNLMYEVFKSTNEEMQRSLKLSKRDLR